MIRKRLFLFVLTGAMLLSGCLRDIPSKPQEEVDTFIYPWMAGESPVPERRVGLLRQGLINTPQAISPSGVYFMEQGGDSKGNFILYADHGSDTLIRLCGRADCSHSDEDCNAYLYRGSSLSYYNDHLYGVSGKLSEEACMLVRMNPDGSNHVAVLDILEFAREHGGDYVEWCGISDGILMFDVWHWVEDETYGEDPYKKAYCGTFLQSYYYRLDGSMRDPEEVNCNGLLLNDIPNGFLVWLEESKTGIKEGSFWSWDFDTNTGGYLTDYPGQFGWFDEKQVYYHWDGAICRRDNATGTETVMVETGLEGDYYLTAFPDCIVLTSLSAETTASKMIYIYNWAFELIDAVNIDYPHSSSINDLLICETAERFILSDNNKGNPLYYIEKSELGTGNVQIHEFQYFK